MKEGIESLTLAHFKYFPEILGFRTSNFKDLELINCGLGSSMFNIVFGGTEVEVQEVIDSFNKQPFAWWIPPSAKSSSLNNLLKKNGFIVEANEEIMLCQLESFDANYHSNNSQILQVLTREHLHDFISVLLPYDETAKLFYNQLNTSDLKGKEKLFVGYVDNVPAVIAILFSDKNISGIFSLVTKEEYRGKGLGSNMMKFLMAFAKVNGSSYACLSSSSNSGYKIYQSLGFKVIGNYECFEYKGE